MPIELAIFDCDGVLVDSEILGNQVLVDYVREFGIDLDIEEAVTLFRGCKMADCVAIIEQRLGTKPPDDFISQLRARTAEAFERELRPVDGIAQALSQIDIPVCVASSGPVEKIKLALTITGLLPYFQNAIFSSYTIGSWKPEPDLFLHAASSMGFEPAACAVIEDSILGVRAGIAAKMRVFSYCSPSEADTFRGNGAIPFHSMRSLPELLKVTNEN